MNKIVAFIFLTMMVSGSILAQETEATAKVQHNKTAKHTKPKKKKHHRLENGTADAERSANPLVGKSITAPPANTRQTAPSY